jgi:alkyl hydroperoxide reductase subunit AhpC
VVQLHHHQAELRQLGVQVLTISFSTDYWARAWLQETGSSFPLLLDPERQAYAAYRLGSSRLRSWGPNVLWDYLKRMVAGERLRPAQGDAHQLGGDFIVDAAGIIRLAHPSRDPTDRPPVKTLLAALQAMAAGSLPGRKTDSPTD